MKSDNESLDIIEIESEVDFLDYAKTKSFNIESALIACLKTHGLPNEIQEFPSSSIHCYYDDIDKLVACTGLGGLLTCRISG